MDRDPVMLASGVQCTDGARGSKETVGERREQVAPAANEDNDFPHYMLAVSASRARVCGCLRARAPRESPPRRGEVQYNAAIVWLFFFLEDVRSFGEMGMGGSRWFMGGMRVVLGVGAGFVCGEGFEDFRGRLLTF